jgi:hypothetical protein
MVVEASSASAPGSSRRRRSGWACQSNVAPVELRRLSEARTVEEVTSVPLSLTIAPGRPRRAISAFISRTTRLPLSEMSGTAARHSLVASSISSARGTSGRSPAGRERSPSTSGCWGHPASGSGCAPPRCADTTTVGVPPALPRRRAAGSSCGLWSSPRFAAGHAGGGSRTASAGPPARRSRARRAVSSGRFGRWRSVLRSDGNDGVRPAARLRRGSPRDGATASRMVASVTVVLPAAPSARRCRATRAWSRFSFAFSSSSAFSRFASETSIPPHFAFQA